MPYAKVVSLLLATGLVGCNTAPKPVETSPYVPAAVFAQQKLHYDSDVAVLRTEHETTLWDGDQYGGARRGWDVVEWRTVTVTEQRIVRDEPVLAAPERTETQLFKRVERKIHFAFDKAVLTDAAKTILKALPYTEADALIIDAHADAIGSDVYNDKLSSRRAEAVKKYLIAQGASQNIIEVAHHGEREPEASNNSKRGRAANRRAVIRVVIKDGLAEAQP